ncbi:hypothetical protein SDC9_103896 [bioreactor metagenome]|uniref:HTH tetR-type domain-containing protein n=1 Tax=bioreactor metagenome TaxID=1076179 RepID=A0A645AWD7_9ZZZZ
MFFSEVFDKITPVHTNTFNFLIVFHDYTIFVRRYATCRIAMNGYIWYSILYRTEVIDMPRLQTGSFEYTRRTITQKAAHLMAENGPEGATLGCVASALGISKGTLYYYYPAKTALINDIAEYYFERTSDALLEWVEALPQSTTFQDGLRLLLETFTYDKQLTQLRLWLAGEAARSNAYIRERIIVKRHEWQLLLELGALKLTGCTSEMMRRMGALIATFMDGALTQYALLGDAALPSEILAAALCELSNQGSGINYESKKV